MTNIILEIEDLHARVEGREILKGINLSVRAGEVHAVMGPNGSGKSTLAQILAGREGYEVTAGQIAVQRAQSQDVKDFAQKMVDAHSETTTKLKGLVAEGKVKQPKGVEEIDDWKPPAVKF